LQPQEVKDWTDQNMDSICAKFRPDIEAKIKETETNAELETKALDDAFNVLSDGGDEEVKSTDDDAEAFFEMIDIDNKGEITGA